MDPKLCQRTARESCLLGFRSSPDDDDHDDDDEIAADLPSCTEIFSQVSDTWGDRSREGFAEISPCNPTQHLGLWPSFPSKYYYQK